MGIISLRRTFSHATYYYALYALACVVTFAIGALLVLSAYDLRQLEPRDYNMRRCELAGNPTGPVLRVLDAVYIEGQDAVSTWCHSGELARYYGAIELRSVHRDHLDLRELYESRYDLILAKPELMHGGATVESRGIAYHRIAQYPNYGSQLVSLQGTPELTDEWLGSRKLGLLDDPNSVSAYQIPLSSLQRLGLDGVPEIIYFRSYRQMYRALFDGKIDVIASILSDEGPDSVLQLPPGLILAQDIPGAGWYLHADLLQAPEHCALLAALQETAEAASVDYFRKLQLVMPCNVP